MSLRLDSVATNNGAEFLIHPTNLTLERGSLNVLLGATLAGKTSLMRLMAGLDKPSSGRILWDGEDVTRHSVQQRDVAMVYQQFINYPTMTVYDNIASPLRIKGKSKAEIKKAVESTAELMQLGGYLQRKPLELSGGQQQRCALARSLVKDAGLVLLDEPLANLDYKLREELREEFPRIFAQSGAIFVYATTEPEEALLLGGNTATMWQGRVTQFGPAPEVYRRPNDALTASVYSNPPMNFFNIEQHDAEFRSLDGEKIAIDNADVALSEQKYRVGFRANKMRLDERNANNLCFKTTLTDSEITGSETYLHLRYKEEHWVGVLPGVHRFTNGCEMPVYLDQDALFIFNEQGQLARAANGVSE